MPAKTILDPTFIALADVKAEPSKGINAPVRPVSAFELAAFTWNVVEFSFVIVNVSPSTKEPEIFSI